MRNPFTSPHKTPTKKPDKTLASGCTPKSCINKPITTPDSPKIDPTERSIPPVIITIVMPQAMTPMKETFRIIVKMLATDKNPFAVIPKKHQDN